MLLQIPTTSVERTPGPPLGQHTPSRCHSPPLRQPGRLVDNLRPPLPSPPRASRATRIHESGRAGGGDGKLILQEATICRINVPHLDGAGRRCSSTNAESICRRPRARGKDRHRSSTNAESICRRQRAMTAGRRCSSTNAESICRRQRAGDALLQMQRAFVEGKG